MTPLIARLKAAAERATPGPYFAAPDDALDTIPHRNSGLALVDTGRTGDGEWPIARLCEWNSANFIALLTPERVLRIVAALEAADMLLDEVAQAAPLLDMFPDDLAEAMGGMRAALAALEEE